MIHLCGRRYAQRAGETTCIKVYSNQPRVTLYLNGDPVEVQTGSRVFSFTVALKEGFNIITAAAGDVKDSMTLEKVEQEPSIYTLPEDKERAEGVANWFKLAGDLDLKAPMEFPEGKYSIRDTLEEIAKCPEAIAMVSEAIMLATGRKVCPGEGMWIMMKAATPEKLCKMGGAEMPEGFMESLNAKLIKFDKK